MKKFKEIIKNNEVITLVTHDGVPHTDDLMCVAILALLVEAKGKTWKLIRTRDPKMELPEDSIVFDVFDGPLDHHKTDEIQDGRVLSSIGKVWRWIKNDAMQEFGFSERGWKEIDHNLFRAIDHSDNTGEMNPLNWLINSTREQMINCSTDPKVLEDAFYGCLNVCSKILGIAIKKAISMDKLDKDFRDLPVIVKFGKNWKINENPEIFIPMSHVSGIDGYLWKTRSGTWMVRALGDWKLKSSPNAVFVHKAGFLAEIKEQDLLQELL